MRRLLFIAGLLLVFPAPSPAAEGEGTLRLRGAVEVRWEGRPGACEALGLCGVRGVLRWAPDGRAEIEYSGGPGHWRPQFLNDYTEARPVVRVLRTAADGTTGACIDTSGGDQQFGDLLSVVVGEGGTTLLTMASPYDPGPLSTGRCAGPLPADIAAALPEAVFRRGATMDLRARTPFSAGPFAGVVHSTLRATAGPVRRRAVSRSDTGGWSGPAPTGEAPRLVAVTATYRVVSSEGGFHADVRGAPAPACQAADACGATGTLDLGLEALAGRTFALTGVRVLRSGEAYGPAQGLRDLGAGRLLDLFGGFTGNDPEYTTTASVQQSGESAVCRDTATGVLPGLQADGRRRVAFTLDTSSYGGLGDVLRTRCAGPTLGDVTGGRSLLLSGAVSAARLAEDAATVVLRGSGAFFADAWEGERGGALTLVLERTKVGIGAYG